MIHNFILQAGSGDGSVKDSVADIAQTHDQIILALIAVVATSVAALVWVIRNSRTLTQTLEQASAANAAVNNVGPGQHRLYQMVEHIAADVETLKAEQHDFDGHGWDHLPPDLADAVALTETIRQIQETDRETAEALKISRSTVANDWNMAKAWLHRELTR